MKKETTEIVQSLGRERDSEFIEKFCVKGTYLDDDGNTVDSISCNIAGDKYLDFMRKWEQKMLKVLGSLMDNESEKI